MFRVVISSGNLTVGDWTVWSNCLWYKDFPKKSLMIDQSFKKEAPKGAFDFDKDFTDNLKEFIQNLMPYKTKYSVTLDIDIDEYFISDIDIILIPSIPGRHREADLEKYGHRRVRSVLRKIGFTSDKAAMAKKYNLTYQTSSVGNLDEKFLKEILSSFLPNYLNPEELKEKKPRGKKAAQAPPLSSAGGPGFASDRVKMVFPTKEYIENSLEGQELSGCLILAPEIYERTTFPKNILHQFQGSENYAFNDGIIPHLKVFVVMEESGEITDDTYIYFGSHNFSAAAWGRYEKDCSQISISNTELGVLYPPAKGNFLLRCKFLSEL